MIIKTLSVTEVNNYLKKIVDNDFILNNLNVKGEISNLKVHSSGHIYFSLKDDLCKINCIMFRSDAASLTFKPKDGMKVEMKCRLSTYVKDGTYQLYCRQLKQGGIGDLFVQFQLLKEDLFKEGLFDEQYKKPIPSFPQRIGVVTSPTGAAIKDIINVVKRRNSFVDIVLYPSLVQGEGASEDLIKGIEFFNKNNTVDIIIIGRGGGSIEELWAFNDKNLAYTIFKSKIPIISGIGHEVDFTIADFVSDIRAATPSAAAEIAVPQLSEIIDKILNTSDILKRSISRILSLEKNRIGSCEKLLKTYSPLELIVNEYNKIDNLKDKLNKSIHKRVDNTYLELRNANNLLVAFNPTNVLNKGYAIIEDSKDRIIRDLEHLRKENEIKITLKDGSTKITISSIE
ncbi:exodeoxyribonuclease 7 large subunit [Clostridium polyendosporum]|uniref:Exodeoxyribonuclease 7 large subunit n=1 Tax=Clostridium polyendosporum TaxID=69208 RepID=A0A919VDF6_9CLOT|nr:exodeoxyribonuclease VII large subunit [Clostridium polyendosporum]GIM27944.1 exodeoxyribonuclease 7 large subunit [Clostridium polyendosporum]